MLKNNIILLFLGSFLFYSCKQKSGSGETYTLAMKLNKNDSFHHDMNFTMDMTMEIMGQPMDMKMDFDAATLFKVVDVRQVEKELTMTYTKLNTKMAMKANGEDISIPDTTNDQVIGKEITLILDDKNDVIRSYGIEVLWSDSTQPELKKELEKMFSVEQINGTYGLMFKIFPDKPVQIGDEWTQSTLVNFGSIKMNIDMTYELLSVKDGVANIGINGKVKGKGSMEMQGTTLEMDLSGGESGTMSIWVNTGFMRDSKYEMDMSGIMKTMGQEVPVTMKGYYIMKGEANDRIGK